MSPYNLPFHPDKDVFMNLDRLSLLLEQFRVRAHLFYNGSLCGVTR
ncbi:hypothetical protein ACMTAU_03805, partial [Alcaligenes pakistanensis]